MRTYLASYDIVAPQTIDEVLQLMHNENCRPIAGGTDLMVLLETGYLPSGKYVNIWNMQKLQGIRVNDEKITIGALTTYEQIRNHPVLKVEFPNLCKAAQVTGGIAIQNRGTIGGNIVNASPAADTPPVLLTYDASLKIISHKKERIIPYNNFHLGYKKIDLEPCELIQEIYLPRNQKHLIHHYYKVGARKAQAISKIAISAVANVENNCFMNCKIALSSVAPTVIRCYNTEKYLNTKKINRETLCCAQEIIKKEISPIDDIRSTKNYRTQVVCNLLEEFLDLAKEKNE